MKQDKRCENCAEYKDKLAVFYHETTGYINVCKECFDKLMVNLPIN